MYNCQVSICDCDGVDGCDSELELWDWKSPVSLTLSGWSGPEFGNCLIFEEKSGSSSLLNTTLCTNGWFVFKIPFFCTPRGLISGEVRGVTLCSGENSVLFGNVLLVFKIPFFGKPMRPISGDSEGLSVIGDTRGDENSDNSILVVVVGGLSVSKTPFFCTPRVLISVDDCIPSNPSNPVLCVASMEGWCCTPWELLPGDDVGVSLIGEDVGVPPLPGDSSEVEIADDSTPLPGDSIGVEIPDDSTIGVSVVVISPSLWITPSTSVLLNFSSSWSDSSLSKLYTSAEKRNKRF